jgi:peptidoglycan-associated lipoprotein
MLTGTVVWGQQATSTTSGKRVSIDLAATYASEQAQKSPGGCCFWLQGGGLDAVATLRSGWGIAAAINGEHASNVMPSVDLNTISFLAGPRYTYTTRISHAGTQKQRDLQVYGEWLLGSAHGYNGMIPTTSGIQTSDNVFAFQVGGGFNLTLSKHFGLRLLQVDYVRTTFPNETTNTQDDLSLASGVSYHFGKR